MDSLRDRAKNKEVRRHGTWSKDGKFKRDTKAFSIASQDQAIRKQITLKL